MADYTQGQLLLLFKAVFVWERMQVFVCEDTFGVQIHHVIYCYYVYVYNVYACVHGVFE